MDMVGKIYVSIQKMNMTIRALFTITGNTALPNPHQKESFREGN